MVRSGVPRGTPYTVPGKSSSACTCHSASCRSGEKSLSGISCRDPTDRDGRFRGQPRVDVQHAVDAQFRSSAGDRARGTARCSGRNEDLVLDRSAVEVNMRADEHGVAHCRWVARPAAYQGVLHNHHVVADPDLTILGRKHGAMQHSLSARRVSRLRKAQPTAPRMRIPGLPAALHDG